MTYPITVAHGCSRGLCYNVKEKGDSVIFLVYSLRENIGSVIFLCYNFREKECLQIGLRYSRKGGGGSGIILRYFCFKPSYK